MLNTYTCETGSHISFMLLSALLKSFSKTNTLCVPKPLTVMMVIIMIHDIEVPNKSKFIYGTDIVKILRLIYIKPI